MRYIAAYVLAVMGGTDNPTSDDIKKIIGSVGVESEDDKIKLVIEKLKGKNIEELLEEGKDLLAKVSCGGAPQVQATATTAATEEKKEVKEDKPAADDGDSSDGDMGFGLFD